jgi:hypothetical protein
LSVTDKSTHNYLGHFINGSGSIAANRLITVHCSTLVSRALRCKSVGEEGQEDADTHDSCCIIIKGSRSYKGLVKA